MSETRVPARPSPQPSASASPPRSAACRAPGDRRGPHARAPTRAAPPATAAAPAPALRRVPRPRRPPQPPAQRPRSAACRAPGDLPSPDARAPTHAAPPATAPGARRQHLRAVPRPAPSGPTYFAYAPPGSSTSRMRRNSSALGGGVSLNVGDRRTCHPTDPVTASSVASGCSESSRISPSSSK